MNPKTLEEMPRVDQVYYLVEELVERLSNTVWGSAAFDVEKGDARYKINKLIDRVIKQSNLALLERIEAKMKPVLDDISNAGTIFTRNGLEGSGREMHENIGYIKGIFHNLKKELEHPND